MPSDWQHKLPTSFQSKTPVPFTSSEDLDWQHRLQQLIERSVTYGYGLGRYGQGFYGIGEGNISEVLRGLGWQEQLINEDITSKTTVFWQHMPDGSAITAKVTTNWQRRRTATSSTQTFGWGTQPWGTSPWGGGIFETEVDITHWLDYTPIPFVSEVQTVTHMEKL